MYEVVVLGVLIRGLQNLESPFGKVLILFVRNRHCGELIRGLENLESPERETFLFFSLVRKEPKVPQRVATLWTPGGRFKSPLDTKFYPK